MDRWLWWPRFTCLPLLFLLLAPQAANAVIRRAFVTSVSGNGNFSTWPDDGGLAGLAAANKICQNRAAASGLGIPNPSGFRAFVSTDGPTGIDGYCNVLGLTGLKTANCNVSPPLPEAGPWRMANGATFFAHELVEILDSSPEILAPLARDENFAALPSYEASKFWTGTSQYGIAVAPNCANWTSASSAADGRVGSGFGTSQRLANAGVSDCNETRRLLCLEGAAGDPLPPVTTVGSLVFVTSDYVSSDLGSDPRAAGATGVAAGDNICKSFAAEGHLPSPSSFFAYLGSTGIDPANRITAPGPFVRPDGFIVANNEVDLFDGTTDNTIHQTESGTYLSLSTFVHTGADSSGTATGDDCEDWTYDDDVAFSSTMGDAGLARSELWTDQGSLFGCSIIARLYCFSNQVVLFWESFELTGDLSRWSDVAP